MNRQRQDGLENVIGAVMVATQDPLVLEWLRRLQESGETADVRAAKAPAAPRDQGRAAS